jgi:hypothetical protein
MLCATSIKWIYTPARRQKIPDPIFYFNSQNACLGTTFTFILRQDTATRKSEFLEFESHISLTQSYNSFKPPPFYYVKILL